MTARTLIASLLLPSSLLALPAAAQASSEGSETVSSERGSGLTLGVRAAYGLPFGYSINNLKLSSTFRSTLSPQVDVGYFFNRNLSVGAYFQHGLAFPGNDRCGGSIADCSASASVTRFGLDLNYHFAPSGSLSPWVGGGAGYELASTTLKVRDVESRMTSKGFEFLHLQGGLDFRVSRSFSVGPYVTGTLGSYEKRTLSFEGTDTPDEDFDKALHAWLQPGLRLQLRL